MRHSWMGWWIRSLIDQLNADGAFDGYSTYSVVLGQSDGARIACPQFSDAVERLNVKQTEATINVAIIKPTAPLRTPKIRSHPLLDESNQIRCASKTEFRAYFYLHQRSMTMPRQATDWSRARSYQVSNRAGQSTISGNAATSTSTMTLRM